MAETQWERDARVKLEQRVESMAMEIEKLKIAAATHDAVCAGRYKQIIMALVGLALVVSPVSYQAIVSILLK